MLLELSLFIGLGEAAIQFVLLPRSGTGACIIRGDRLEYPLRIQ